MNLQIQSMFDAEPSSAELSSSRKRFAKRPFHQWNTQSSNPTPRKPMALETRTPNSTHPRSRRTAPQASGDNSTEQGGVPKPQKVRHPKKTNGSPLLPHVNHTNHPAALKHLPRVRVKATSTTSAINLGVVSSNHHVPKKPDRSTCAL